MDKYGDIYTDEELNNIAESAIAELGIHVVSE